MGRGRRRRSAGAVAAAGRRLLFEALLVGGVTVWRGRRGRSRAGTCLAVPTHGAPGGELRRRLSPRDRAARLETHDQTIFVGEEVIPTARREHRARAVVAEFQRRPGHDNVDVPVGADPLHRVLAEREVIKVIPERRPRLDRRTDRAPPPADPRGPVLAPPPQSVPPPSQSLSQLPCLHCHVQ